LPTLEDYFISNVPSSYGDVVNKQYGIHTDNESITDMSIGGNSIRSSTNSPPRSPASFENRKRLPSAEKTVLINVPSAV
jgi:hypothetical protein